MRLSAILDHVVDAAPLALIVVAVLGVPLTYFIEWQMDHMKRQDALRIEIAQGFANNWHRCDLAARFDPAVPCGSPGRK
jgi:hypothetical protein